MAARGKLSLPLSRLNHVFFNYKDGDLVKAISADADHLERMARQLIRKQKP
ncbi:unnamed protein product [Brassica oleracea]|uniref:Uncharacterized protein n=1 Tax=Brassica oleracea TaxID=3712 RepID=A0A3P6CER5_BRAOL|nr:unnamed protein product [Brassica oleracea]